MAVTPLGGCKDCHSSSYTLEHFPSCSRDPLLLFISWFTLVLQQDQFPEIMPAITPSFPGILWKFIKLISDINSKCWKLLEFSVGLIWKVFPFLIKWSDFVLAKQFGWPKQGSENVCCLLALCHCSRVSHIGCITPQRQCQQLPLDVGGRILQVFCLHL